MMERPRRAGRTVKACTNCRQQKVSDSRPAPFLFPQLNLRAKLRCDANENRSRQCSRCDRLDLECVVLRTFKRVKKKTKAELQHEVEILRQQIHTGSSASPPVDNYFAPASNGDQEHVTAPLIPDPSPGDQTIGDDVRSDGRTGHHDLNETPLLPGMLDRRIRNESPCTLPRSLNGYSVEAQKIDDCFFLFFSHYSHVLPILDACKSPDVYYSRCPLLFWTILGVGSRQYRRDPTLLTRLAPCIESMALSSLASRVAVIEMIQSLLLLSLWPFPFNSANKAMVHIFSGAAVNLAQQIGLHVVGVGQDFARVKIDADEAAKAYRAQLWHYCLLVNQSASYADGLLPGILTTQSHTEIQRAKALLPPSLQYQRQIYEVAVNATQAMQQAGVADDNGCSAALLHALIDNFDRELSSIPLAEGSSHITKLHYAITRLHIRTFTFFSTPGPETFMAIVDLYHTAVSAIDALTSTSGPAAACPFFMYRVILLAAFSILKILRSDAHQSAVDASVGEDSYFSAIMFLKQMSMAHDDITARSADILAQLWASDTVFKGPDGKRDSLSLRIRSRLTISVVYDCFWWWREEIAGMSSPYQERRTVNQEAYFHDEKAITRDRIGQ
ncbi:uncharacterized protein N7459_003744 [Penicillium hispanicum]|uniref:uncharacterized protein n=1 Tax=Penicillium hispanicum TaxID=1080232 RepID=UPI00254048C8|nr:uncharacterized protein N7459_003744 [Penicillium hispanicum]KAJ5587979.1 hypothetical protein N7459_003744 [Penicillium hispanicum]